MNYEPNIDKRKDFLNRAYAHAMTAVEQNRRKRGNTMSEGQIEREYCITTAKKCLQNFVDSKMPVFSSDEENILGSGIIAKCIEDEKTPFINVNLEGAARELAAEITGDIEWTALRMTQLVGEMLLDIAIAYLWNAPRSLQNETLRDTLHSSVQLVGRILYFNPPEASC